MCEHIYIYTHINTLSVKVLFFGNNAAFRRPARGYRGGVGESSVCMYVCVYIYIYIDM